MARVSFGESYKKPRLAPMPPEERVICKMCGSNHYHTYSEVGSNYIVYICGECGFRWTKVIK